MKTCKAGLHLGTNHGGENPLSTRQAKAKRVLKTTNLILAKLHTVISNDIWLILRLIHHTKKA